ncbi:MAG: DUF4302 domain-containing protein, partial [Tunicatimonas sp.]|uniref:DUF4302 domain-containing protein n=1 Tax=Tunicatimonas sp. TaxID=1940096 RepID=UPI003C77FB76
VSTLKNQLVAPSNGWVLRYRPIQESGTYIVLLNFDENDNLRIRTDFGLNDNEFFDQTITYRVDNSLGLELIFESYSFFSFLYEQGGATFLAEYEFDYVNETPDGDLVFRSKTDPSSPTTLVFQSAPDNAESLLGRTLNANLETLSESLGVVSPVYRLNFTNRDLSLFLSFNTALRTINFTSASLTSGERRQSVNFSTGYTAQGNSIVLDEPLSGNFSGTEVNVSAINFQNLTDASAIVACDQTFNVQQYQGSIAESNESIALLPTLFEPGGISFADDNQIFLARPTVDIYNNGERVGNQIAQDIEGITDFVIFNQANRSGPFVSIGFGIRTPNGDFIVPVKSFEAAYTGNQVAFTLGPSYDLALGDNEMALDTLSMDFYINNLTEGGQVRILQSREEIYELYNPCTGWSVILQSLN